MTPAPVLRGLARRLFTVATTVLEDATQIGVAGQSSKLTEGRCETHGRKLRLVGQDIALIAETAVLMARLSRQSRRSRPPKTSR